MSVERGGEGGGNIVLIYQRGNQNPYIEEQTPQRKVQRTNNDLQNIHIN
jgi:hypothetical protein